MEKRQKILLGIFVIGLAGYTGNWAYESLYATKVSDSRAAIDRAKRTAMKGQKIVIESRAAKLQLEKWRELTLSSDPNTAVPQYQSFLLDLTTQSGFEQPQITQGNPSTRDGAYWRYPFELQTTGTLEHLVTFLDAFHGSKIMHKIPQMTVTPSGDQDVQVRMSIEAIGLINRGMDPTEPDSEQEGDIILTNNLLKSAAKSTDTTKKIDGNQLVVTGTFTSTEKPEAMFHDPSSEKSLTLHVGDRISTSTVEGRILDISSREVVLEIAGRWYTVQLGAPLANRVAMSRENALAREIGVLKRGKPAAN